MRAKFIYEKFKADSDPIKDMGIGVAGLITEDIIPQLHDLDDKIRFYLRSLIDTKTGPKWGYAQMDEPSIRSIEVSKDGWLLIFRVWSDAYYSEHSHRKVNKRKYIKSLLKKIGISSCVDEGYCLGSGKVDKENDHDAVWIIFNINPKYHHKFKQISHYSGY